MNKEIEVVNLSPAGAIRWLKNYEYVGQRTLRKWWASHLNNQMKQGKFAPKTNIHLAHNGKATYLIDGKHRLTALAMGNVKPIDFVITHHYVKKDVDLATMYSRLDQGLKRSFSDVSDAWGLIEATGLDNKTQLNQLNAACNALVMRWGIKHGSVAQRIDLEESVANVVEWAPYGKLFFASVHGGELGTLILKASVMSIGMVTFKHEPELADIFWKQISYNDGLGRYDPRARLHRWLLDARKDRITHSGQVTYSNSEFALACARCWNAHIDHQELQKLYIPSIPPEGYLIKLTDVRIG